MKLSFSRNGSSHDAAAPAGYSVIDAQMFVRGDLATDGTIRIDGRLEGSILKSDIVVIGAKASVVGNIVAREVVIGGSVEGNITAESRVELDSVAIVVGDILAGSILTHEGAQIRGTVVVRTGDGELSATPANSLGVASAAASEALSEVASTAATLVARPAGTAASSANAMSGEAPPTDAEQAHEHEQAWVFPPGTAPKRPVRITPPEEDI